MNVLTNLDKISIEYEASNDEFLQLSYSHSPHLSVKIDGEDRDDVAEVLNNAMKEAQKKAAMKMAQMGGGLKGLLGGS